MTELLARDRQVQALPKSEQDEIASMILDEIKGDRRWDESFFRSPTILAKLAANGQTTGMA